MDRLNLRVPTRLDTWPKPDEQATGLLRLAGVSSFGMGGTNAHVVVEEAPVPEEGEFVGDAPLAVVPVVVTGCRPVWCRSRVAGRCLCFRAGDAVGGDGCPVVGGVGCVRGVDGAV
ncbi:ketoacyl-synthetase C-terminal extension domain-containing protein [Streptomyces goshikiensis]|uniref:ketoacyl-synthetase C-terminal extension domain-containing protein n=1 Tax=Streptomyces goshikiensis TaxID=1942 RepID=UPI0036BE190F